MPDSPTRAEILAEVQASLADRHREEVRREAATVIATGDEQEAAKGRLIARTQAQAAAQYAASVEGIAAKWRSEHYGHGAFGLPGFGQTPAAPAPEASIAKPSGQHRSGSLEDIAERWNLQQKAFGGFGLP